MAVNKRKILDAARKYVQKGAKQKALKEFERLLKIDPKDGKIRLEIGDAHRRWGQIDEATSHYTKVAEQYKQDGFDARAVAVYKQVLNLDPKRYSAYVALSELYQRMGLDAEAISALQSAADGYHKEGQKREALELLRKMAQLDPTNTTSRMKVAELLRQEGLEDDAVSEFEAVAEELDRQGALEQVASVYARILEAQPGRVDILVATARTLVKLRQPERAEPFARQASEADPGDAEKVELLCDIYKALDRMDELATATRGLAKIYRDRGDDERAREIMQRVPGTGTLEMDPSDDAPEFGSAGTFDASVDDGALADEELLDEDFLAGDENEISMTMPVEEPADGAEASGDRDGAREAPMPDGDPEQLFAEASVYLRYGKRDQAIASLRGIVAQEPGHRGALEKLGEAYAEEGDTAAAVESWVRAAECAAEAEDAGAFEVLRDRIAALDSEAAAALEAPAGASAAPEPEPAAGDAADGIDLDVDIDMDVDAGAAAADDDDASEDAGSSDDAALELPDEVEIDLDADVDASAEAESAAGSAEADVEVDLDLDLAGDDAEAGGADIEVDVDLSDAEAEAARESADADGAGGLDDAGDVDLELDLDVDVQADHDGDAGGEAAAAASGEGSQSAGGLSATTSQRIQEELEEAEFYFGQGMHDEAEAVYRRILELAPQHPSALLRLGEIFAARGGEPPSAGDGGDTAAEGALSTPTLDQAGESAAGDDEDDDTQSQVDLQGDDSASQIDLEGEDSASEIDLQDDESGSQIDLQDDDSGSQIDPSDEDTAVSGAEAEDTGGVDLAAELAAEEEAEEAERAEAAARARKEAPEETQPIAAEGDDDALFDLAAELREAMEGEDDPNASTSSGTAEDGFDAIFSEFKKGVSQTLSEGDSETRYDLGIAYREMGLFEDAIGEFRVCLASEDRRLDSLTMMGLCAMDVGRPADAISHFEQALATPDLPNEQRTGLQYDLGLALEQAGDLARARASFEQVAASDPDFCDVRTKLAELAADAGSTAAGPAGDADTGEGFESFDDLIAEAEVEGAATAAAEEPEAFESFDDVITEAEAEPEPGDDDTQEQIDADVDSPDSPSRRKGRKKRISFV